MSKVSVIIIPVDLDEPLTLQSIDTEDYDFEYHIENNIIGTDDPRVITLDEASDKFNSVRMKAGRATRGEVNKRAVTVYRMFKSLAIPTRKVSLNAVIVNYEYDSTSREVGDPRDLPDKFVEQMQVVFGRELEIGQRAGRIVDLGDPL